MQGLISGVCLIVKHPSLRGSILFLEHPEVFTLSYLLKLTSYLWHMPFYNPGEQIGSQMPEKEFSWSSSAGSFL